jgi:hypothetical protein
MWNKAIVVEEESHGVIGVAFDINGAIACAKDWNCGALLTCDDRPATEEELSILSQKVVNKSSIAELNDFFEGYYSFSIFPIWACGEKVMDF